MKIDGNGATNTRLPGMTMAQLVTGLQNAISTKGNGEWILEQRWVFADLRTGTPQNPDGTGALLVKKSGYEIKVLAEKDMDTGKYFVKVTRKAKANNGAEAGENVSSEEQTAEIK